MSDEQAIKDAAYKEAYTKAQEKYKQILDQREEIMTAFIAKYKCEPDEMVQVEWHRQVQAKFPNETIEKLWFLVRKSDCIYCESCKAKLAEGKPKDVQ